LFAAAFVILVPLAIWIYTLVFAFSSLWFAHYALAALQALRLEPLMSTSTTTPPPAGGVVPASSHAGRAVPASPHAQARFGTEPFNSPDDITDVEPRPSR
jgi:hypothetical protein